MLSETAFRVLTDHQLEVAASSLHLTMPLPVLLIPSAEVYLLQQDWLVLAPKIHSIDNASAVVQYMIQHFYAADMSAKIRKQVAKCELCANAEKM